MRENRKFYFSSAKLDPWIEVQFQIYVSRVVLIELMLALRNWVARNCRARRMNSQRQTVRHSLKRRTARAWHSSDQQVQDYCYLEGEFNGICLAHAMKNIKISSSPSVYCYCVCMCVWMCVCGRKREISSCINLASNSVTSVSYFSSELKEFDDTFIFLSRYKF